MEQILRAACVAVGLVVAILAVAVAATASPTIPDAVYTHQGETISISHRTVSSSSVCVFAPSGTTCTGGLTLPSNVRAVSVQNHHGTDALFCDETTAVASEGLRIAAGATFTFSRSSRDALYCIRGSTNDIVVGVIVEAK